MNSQPPRIPNFKRLLISGAVIGVIVGVAVSVFGAPAGGYSETTAAMYLGALGAVVGVALAGLLGVLLDRSGRNGA